MAGTALCEPPCADFVAGAIQNAFSRDSGSTKYCVFNRKGGSEAGKSSFVERRAQDGLGSWSGHGRIMLRSCSDHARNRPSIVVRVFTCFLKCRFVAATALCEPPCADFVAGTAPCEPPCALCEPPRADFVAGTALCEPPCAEFVAGAALSEPQGADFVAGTALCEPLCADFVAGTALCEPPCADFVAGTALCEPRGADFVAGTALCEPPCADFVASTALC